MTYSRLLPAEEAVTSHVTINGRTLPGRFFVDFERFEVSLPEKCCDFDSEDDLKEWLWLKHRDTILNAMKIKFEDEQTELQQYRMRLDLLDKVAHVQRQYLQSEGPRVVYGCLLTGLLELMKSEYGFIGEVKYEDDGTMYVLTHATTDISWDEPTRKLYRDNVEKGLRFYNLNTLFGQVLTTKQPVISNNPKTDKRAGGIPKGHPPLNHFLGIPFFNKAGDIIGMVGIANKPGGYSEEDIEFLEPFTITCSNLIQAYWQIQSNKDLINTLEEKVQERTRKLEEANGQLEEANRQVVKASAAQLQHFACMSHEIRTPLNCIVGLSSLLQETELNAMQAECMRMIVTSGDLLLTVVNDVLDYSKLESGNVDFEMGRCSLQETLNAVVHSISMKALDRKLAVKTYYDPRLPEIFYSDSRRLQQILYNLLGNAIKFSKEGGFVELSVTIWSNSESNNDASPDTETPANDHGSAPSGCPFHRTSKLSNAPSNQSGCPFARTLKPVPIQLSTLDDAGQKFIRFTVKDYGKGIEKKDFSLIFQPFRQASAETERVYGGTGLGLAITSKLVHGLGGMISVDSEIEQWSKFTVDLPFSGDGVDSDAVFEELHSFQIVLVDEPSPSTKCLAETFAFYNLTYETVATMGQVMELIQSQSTPRRCICVVNEELYDEGVHDALQRLSTDSFVMISFGPQFLVPRSCTHYRNLSQVLPSVLMNSFCKCAESARRERKETLSQVETRELAVTGANVIPYRDLRVLIAEDNLVNQKVLVRMLKRLGIEHCVVVDNGRKAVDQEASTQYDVVLMDMQMPVMDGLQACRLIANRSEGHPRPPVIFVTAQVSQAFEAECMKAGSSGFLAKPFNLRDIEKILHNKRQVLV